MENAYYFSQGRLVPNNNDTYNKFVDANNARYIKNEDNDIEMGGTNNTANTKDTKNTQGIWYNLSIFRPRKFQIFSASILRYR
jgi:uncharacterized protein YbcV (DUF1398 family)